MLSKIKEFVRSGNTHSCCLEAFRYRLRLIYDGDLVTVDFRLPTGKGVCVGSFLGWPTKVCRAEARRRAQSLVRKR